MGKISNVIKGKKEIVLPMIVQKSVINSYKDSVNGKRSAVNINYIDKIGLDKVREHAFDFINNRLKIFDEVKDGKQTPMRGHPVFIAQHATATCCRGCLEKWHHIPKNRQLTAQEQQYIVRVIMKWIEKEIIENGKI